MRITDGRRKNGKYQSEQIDWFDAHGVDPGVVLADSIVQRKFEDRWMVAWSEAVREGETYAQTKNRDLVVKPKCVFSETPYPV